VDVFYGNDTELSVDSSYDCGEYKIYIPYDTMAPTENIHISSNTETIVENLTSTFCNFGEVVEHRICVHTDETKCYENEAAAPVFVNTENEPPSLDVRGIESKTAIISLFCKKTSDCVGFNDVMAFNYEIHVDGAAGATVSWISAALIVLSGVLLNSE
jgi:hypothetical protein